MHVTYPLYPVESAMVRCDETRGIPVARREGFAADMCRDKQTVRVRDGERPSVSRLRHDLDALGRRLNAMPSEQIGERHASPALRGPPPAGAVEHCLALGGRQRQQLVVTQCCWRSDIPVGFNPSAPKPTDHPSLAAIANAVTRPRNNLPPALVLPDRIVHNTGRVIPGQFAGVMGRARDPWFSSANLRRLRDECADLSNCC